MPQSQGMSGGIFDKKRRALGKIRERVHGFAVQLAEASMQRTIKQKVQITTIAKKQQSGHSFPPERSQVFASRKLPAILTKARRKKKIGPGLKKQKLGASAVPTIFKHVLLGTSTKPAAASRAASRQVCTCAAPHGPRKRKACAACLDSDGPQGAKAPALPAERYKPRQGPVPTGCSVSETMVDGFRIEETADNDAHGEATSIAGFCIESFFVRPQDWGGGLYKQTSKQVPCFVPPPT